MNEALIERLGHQPVSKPCGDFDKVSKHIVELDFQGRHGGLFRIIHLQTGNDLAAIVAQASGFIERGIPTNGDKVPVPRHQRHIVGEGSFEISRQRIKP